MRDEVSGKTNLQLLVNGARDLMAGRDFIWQANRDVERWVGENLVGTKLPNMPHGLNRFMGYDHAVLTATGNPTPGHFRWLSRTLGISGEEVRRFTYLSTGYQSACRCSIRDPDSGTRKLVLVPDLELAEHLERALSGARIEQLDVGGARPKWGGARRPRLYRSNRERQAAYRARKAQNVGPTGNVLHSSQ
jgi:hypothetical protein